MHKTRSADVRMIALIGSAVALAGCMTAGYVVGSVDSAFKGQYQQSAMLNLGLRIDGILYSLHAPVGCRSFVHPIGGMRVTRDSGGLFEFKLQNGGLAYLQIPYSCAESNAEIGFTVSNLVSLYRVAQTPSVTVTRDWAVPPAYAEFEAAQVALTNASFSHDLKTFDANVSVVETILGDLKRKRVGNDDLMLVSLYSPHIALEGPYVESFDAQELHKLPTSGKVLPPIAGNIVRLISKSWVQWFEYIVQGAPILAK